MAGGRITKLWKRYLEWRKGEGVRPPKLPEPPINKLDMDPGDVAAHVTSNPGGATGYMG